MKVLVTGANGFVGLNLTSRLRYLKDIELLLYTKEHSLDDLSRLSRDCDFIVHLAGVNRTNNSDDFYDTNETLIETLVSMLEKHNNTVPILLSSSIQAERDNDYGKSKKAGEDVLVAYSQKHDVPVYIYRLPNLFGKWSKPFYNSVIATWCHQISRHEDVEISNPDHQLQLLYIDDLVEDIIEKINLKQRDSTTLYYEVSPTYEISLKELLEILIEFRDNRDNRYVSNMNNDLIKKLYSTYLSYLDPKNFKYPLISNVDARGSFTEILKSQEFGQISLNVSKAHETKGEHWHHSKNEKFIVVKGKASIKFRNVYSDEIIEYIVSDETLEVVDIPTGYTHNITNLLDEDLITIMWVNEPYDPNNTDTYNEKVEGN